MKRTRFLALASMLMLSLPLAAQTSPMGSAKGATDKDEPPAIILTGKLHKPVVAFANGKAQTQTQAAIVLREDFAPRILSSVDALPAPVALP